MEKSSDGYRIVWCGRIKETSKNVFRFSIRVIRIKPAYTMEEISPVFLKFVCQGKT